MRIRPLVKKSALIAASLVIASSCGKKKSSSTATVSDGSAAPDEDSVVTLATGALQLGSDVTILQGSDAKTTLALGTKEVSFKLLEERKVRLRVTNEAFEDIEKAGSIMCYLSQTKFWEQANKGIYQVQIDGNKCENKDNSGGGGDSSSSGSDQSPDLQIAYIDSKREEGKPLIAEMRIAAGEGKEDAFYHVKVVVVEPPSDLAPAGIFDMRYTAHMGKQTGETGFIRTKRIASDKFVLETGSAGKEGGGSEGKSQGIAELEFVDADTVIGYVHSDSSGSRGDESQSSKGQARFSANFLNVDYVSSRKSPQHSEESATKGCYNLKAYKTAMFRYDLAGADGQTVKLNSGFPIEFTKDGKPQRGWAGYHGIWAGETSVSNGDTVNKVSWVNGAKTETPYTVFAAPGKLTKLTKATITLGELKNVDLNFYSQGTSYIVKWDGTTLAKTAKVIQGKNGQEEEAATGAIEIPQWGAGLWIPSLNANVNISKQMTLNDALTLSYHSETVVSGTTDVPSCELVCFQNCPVAAPTAAAFDRSSGGGGQGPSTSALYKSETVDFGNGQSYSSNQKQNVVTPMSTYTWDATTHNLKLGSAAFTMPTDLTTDRDQLNQKNQIWSGALVCAADHTAIADKNIDPFRLQNNLTTFYRFSAGGQNWNKFVSLKSAAGAFVTFDKPLELAYTHSTANDWDGNTDTSFVGKSFRFQYEGPGNLRGIPWKFSKDIGRHMPLFSIKSGAKTGAYTIYPVDGEKRLAKVADAECAAIPLEGAPALPVLDDKTVTLSDFGDAKTVLLYVSGVCTATVTDGECLR